MSSDLFVVFNIDFKSLQKEFANNDIMKYNPETIEPTTIDTSHINYSNFDQTSNLLPSSSDDQRIITEYQLNINGKEVKTKTYDIRNNHYGDCWWCCHSFDNIPVFIPTAYNKKIDVFDNYGTFCSFNCALSYNYWDTSSNKFSERESLIYLLFRKTNNINFDNDVEIKYAPRKEVLTKFGGNVDIESFRSDNKVFNMIYPPMSYIVPEVEEFTFLCNEEDDTLIPSKNKKDMTIKQRKKKLKKKDAPVERKKMTLDSFF